MLSRRRRLRPADGFVGRHRVSERVAAHDCAEPPRVWRARRSIDSWRSGVTRPSHAALRVERRVPDVRGADADEQAAARTGTDVRRVLHHARHRAFSRRDRSRERRSFSRPVHDRAAHQRHRDHRGCGSDGSQQETGGIVKRKASAEWKGALKDGKGTISTDSGVLKNAQYSFSTRFENGVGTNPEELIAAAHAGCFSMALSAQLGEAGLTADRIDTTATVTMEKTAAGFTVTASHLDLRAKIPGASQAAFDKAAGDAKAGCPISRLLNAKITMAASLEA